MGDGAASESVSGGGAERLSPPPLTRRPALTAGHDSAIAPGGAAAWLRLTHPRELAIGLAPAAATLALLWALGARLLLLPAVLTFVALLLAQAGAHMLSEYVEFERGRVLAAAALLSPEIVDDHPISVAATHPLLALRVAVVLLALGACAGIPLVATGGASVLILGALGLASAILYSSTNYALKRLPGGEFVVLLALGPGIAAATTLAQQQRSSTSVLLLAFALGLLAFAYVLAGNLQTRDDDARVGRHTLAVVLPETVSSLLYVAAAILAFVLALLVALPRDAGPGRGAAAVILALPVAVLATTGVARARGAVARAATVMQTLRLYVTFALWLLIGLLVAGMVVRIVPHL